MTCIVYDDPRLNLGGPGEPRTTLKNLLWKNKLLLNMNKTQMNE